MREKNQGDDPSVQKEAKTLTAKPRPRLGEGVRVVSGNEKGRKSLAARGEETGVTDKRKK